MMRIASSVVVTGLLVAGIAGCSGQRDGSSDRPRAERREGTPPPADSKLAKVQTGMRATEVQDLLGKPDAERSFETGKRWIPWYFGADVRRTVWYFKGLGRVAFNGGNVWGAGGGRVHHTEYDPGETGSGARAR